ncbi:GAF domain-containing protein [Kineococcus indalonis]|uniref:GAF domain-containing protein n=1 Tax=Kineococcus indalonis TaxID=2696566 RepID=UPI00141271C4|nr:GAF domain-containing protein [Kineococcus indalonis]NAZ86566.1 GAF domain-containing protein [Kineococcus indalonis]
MSHLLDSFARTWRAEAAGRDEDVLPSALARACAQVLCYDAAGLSLMSGPDARVPLGASDEVAAVAERLQYTVGDGPCFAAMRTGRAVLVTEHEWEQQWPVLAEQHFARTPFRGGLSVPLRVDSARIGVLDLYLRRSRPLGGADVMEAQHIAAAVTDVLLDTLREHRDGPEHGAALGTWLDSAAARRRRQVWIATGMANLVLALPSDQALAVLRAHAYASERTLDALADDVVTGRFDVAALGTDQLR